MQPGDTITPKHEEHSAQHGPVSPSNVSSSDASHWDNSHEYSKPQQHLANGIVDWTASEFVDHEKNKGWFIELAVIALAAAAVIYLITEDVITVVVIIIAAGLFGATAHRKPRTLKYRLDIAGIHIANRFYNYDSFKSFSILEEGALSSIQLFPLKRFMPPISLYYPPESEDQIIMTLGEYLPHEVRKRDPIDSLMRKVRF